MSRIRYAQDVLAEAASMSHGQELWLSFDSFSDRESMRTTLYKEKKKLARKMPSVAEKITISQRSDDKGIMLVLTKDELKKSFSGLAYIVTPETGEVEVRDLNKLQEVRKNVERKEAEYRTGPSLTATKLDRQTRNVYLWKKDGKIKDQYLQVPDAVIAERLLAGDLTWKEIQTPESWAKEQETEQETPKQELTGEPTLKEMLACMKEAGEITNPLYSEMTVGELAYQVVEKGVSFDTLQGKAEQKIPTTLEELLDQKGE